MFVGWKGGTWIPKGTLGSPSYRPIAILIGDRCLRCQKRANGFFVIRLGAGGCGELCWALGAHRAEHHPEPGVLGVCRLCGCPRQNPQAPSRYLPGGAGHQTLPLSSVKASGTMMDTPTSTLWRLSQGHSPILDWRIPPACISPRWPRALRRFSRFTTQTVVT